MKLKLSLDDEVDGIVFNETDMIDLDSPEAKAAPVMDIIYKIFFNLSEKMIFSKIEAKELNNTKQ